MPAQPTPTERVTKPSDVAAALEPGQHEDEKRKKTGESKQASSSAVRPSGRPSGRSSGTADRGADGEDEKDWTQVPLPEHWSMRTDDRSSRVYYLNHLDKTTQWQHPLKKKKKTKKKKVEKRPSSASASAARNEAGRNDERVPSGSEESRTLQDAKGRLDVDLELSGEVGTGEVRASKEAWA
jgi:hypothetical protein